MKNGGRESMGGGRAKNEEPPLPTRMGKEVLGTATGADRNVYGC
jgi:hypothetical protein